MEKYGYPRKSTALVRQLHDGMRATVLDSGDTSDSFQGTCGVKQGCVLAPALFSMVFAAMFHDDSHDNDDGIQLKYRTDGGSLNLRRLKANRKVKVDTLKELLFADDYALNSNTKEEMQQCVHHLSRACDNFGFTISTKKTKVTHQPAPRKMYHEPHIFVNVEPLKLQIISITWEAPSPETPTLSWKSITYFPKPSLHLEVSGRKCGTEEESAKTPS